MPLAALADTGLPPPSAQQTINNSFPSAQALQRQGYDAKTGVWRVQDTNSGRPTVTSNGGTITGTQNKNVTVTGKYGEKATIQTATTQKVGSSALSKGIAAAYVLDAAQNSESGNYASLARENFKQGNYGSAIHNTIKSVGAIVDRVSQGAFSQAGIVIGELAGTLPSSNNQASNDAALKRIFDRAKQGQAAAEKRGDFAGATMNAAVKKAAEAAGKYEQEKQKEQAGQYYYRASYMGKYAKYGDTPDSACSGQVPGYPSGYTYHLANAQTCTVKFGSNTWLWSIEKIPVKAVAPTAEETNLNGSEVEAILKRMLESQQTNHEELMKQLAKIGDAVQNATTSQEWTAKTATTEPYTPAGSDTPQQTQFSIDQNGNITAKTILRPDLKPNSSQAPMRTEVIKNPNAQSQNQQSQQNGQQQQGEQGQNQQGQQQNQQGQQQNQQGQNTNQTGQQQNQTGQQTGQTGQTTATTGQNAQQQNQQQQNFCQQNPRAAACAELGEADYEDLEIPENPIDLKLEPMDIFSTDGTCPANPTFSLGALGTFGIPYDYFCNIARLLRPILILGTIIMCGFFAYNAVKEL